MVLGDVDTLDSRRILDINFDTGDDDGLTILVLPKVCLRLLVLCAEAEELCSCLPLSLTSRAFNFRPHRHKLEQTSPSTTTMVRVPPLVPPSSSPLLFSL